MEQSKVGRYKFMAEPFHVDCNGELPMNVLSNCMLNAADFHSDARGFGITFLRENKCTWVLSRLAVEMNRMPYQYESFEIETWCEKIYRFFTDRNYNVYDGQGEIIGHARSVWAMIDIDTRKPLDLLSVQSGRLVDYVDPDLECPMEKPSHIKLHEGKLVKEYTSQYSDIDINGHVNSVKYMQHILDIFPMEKYKAQRIKRFEIAYVSECYYGNTLSFYKEEPEENISDIEVKCNDTVACRSRVVFENK
jgi:medium-chain acyl-[acyl-carrier-protein] hydrolase